MYTIPEWKCLVPTYQLLVRGSSMAVLNLANWDYSTVMQ